MLKRYLILGLGLLGFLLSDMPETEARRLIQSIQYGNYCFVVFIWSHEGTIL